MPFELDCDSCDFESVVENEPDSYARAKEHESECPSHFVFITSVG
jgi:hypothetical protein